MSHLTRMPLAFLCEKMYILTLCSSPKLDVNAYWLLTFVKNVHKCSKLCFNLEHDVNANC